MRERPPLTIMATLQCLTTASPPAPPFLPPIQTLLLARHSMSHPLSIHLPREAPEWKSNQNRHFSENLLSFLQRTNTKLKTCPPSWDKNPCSRAEDHYCQHPSYFMHSSSNTSDISPSVIDFWPWRQFPFLICFLCFQSSKHRWWGGAAFFSLPFTSRQ